MKTCELCSFLTICNYIQSLIPRHKCLHLKFFPSLIRILIIAFFQKCNLISSVFKMPVIDLTMFFIFTGYMEYSIAQGKCKMEKTISNCFLLCTASSFFLYSDYNCLFVSRLPQITYLYDSLGFVVMTNNLQLHQYCDHWQRIKKNHNAAESLQYFKLDF